MTNDIPPYIASGVAVVSYLFISSIASLACQSDIPPQKVAGCFTITDISMREHYMYG